MAAGGTTPAAPSGVASVVFIVSTVSLHAIRAECTLECAGTAQHAAPLVSCGSGGRSTSTAAMWASHRLNGLSHGRIRSHSIFMTGLRTPSRGTHFGPAQNGAASYRRRSAAQATGVRTRGVDTGRCARTAAASGLSVC